MHNVFYNNGANAQLMHGRIARHYNLPAVSMQSTIYPEVVAGRIENREITPDDLHPNDAGHALVASVITYFWSKVKQKMQRNRANRIIRHLSQKILMRNPSVIRTATKT